MAPGMVPANTAALVLRNLGSSGSRTTATMGYISTSKPRVPMTAVSLRSPRPPTPFVRAGAALSLVNDVLSCLGSFITKINAIRSLVTVSPLGSFITKIGTIRS